jgi:hypothetical protein
MSDSLAKGSEGERGTPKQWADRFGALFVPGGTVQAFMTLEELECIGPIGIREQLKRRDLLRHGTGEVREFNARHHAAGSEEDEG